MVQLRQPFIETRSGFGPFTSYVLPLASYVLPLTSCLLPLASCLLPLTLFFLLRQPDLFPQPFDFCMRQVSPLALAQVAGRQAGKVRAR